MAFHSGLDKGASGLGSNTLASGMAGLGQKAIGSMSSSMPGPMPGSMAGPMPGSMSGQTSQQTQPIGGQLPQMPKTRKSAGFFGEEEDSETSMYFPQNFNFKPDKDLMNQSQSPSQLTSIGGNFCNPGFGSFTMPQQPRSGITAGAQFQRGNAPTPTSMNPNQSFPPIGGMQQNSPNRGMVSAIGQQRMINQSQNSQTMSNMQKRPIGSGLSSSAAGALSNIGNFGLSQTGFGSVRALDSAQPSFDLSDFPSLGNRVTPSSSSLSGPRNYEDQHVEDRACCLACEAEARQQGSPSIGMVKQPVQEQTPEFQIQQEDFPALPGAQSTLSIFVSDPPSSLTSGDSTRKTPVNLLSGSSYEQALSKDGKFPGDKLGSGPQKRGIMVHPDGRVSNIPAGMVTDQFGIVGLLTFIKSAEMDPNLVALAPGMDLTTLGLNLNSPDNLYSTFQSPWVDLPCRPQDIDFHVPAEYLTNIFIRERLAPIKLNRYGEDLLFFLFYMNGGDVLQLAAAAELYNRDWRYHKEEKVWITRAPGVEPIVKTNTYERGTYYFFDAQNWRKVAKEFHLEYDKLEERPSLPPTLNHNPNQPIAAH